MTAPAFEQDIAIDLAQVEARRDQERQAWTWSYVIDKSDRGPLRASVFGIGLFTIARIPTDEAQSREIQTMVDEACAQITALAILHPGLMLDVQIGQQIERHDVSDIARKIKPARRPRIIVPARHAPKLQIVSR